MKIADLIERLCEEFDDDAVIVVEDENGVLRDFELVETEAYFDGFDGYTPEGLKIVMKD